jgi:hypothetical protein
MHLIGRQSKAQGLDKQGIRHQEGISITNAYHFDHYEAFLSAHSIFRAYPRQIIALWCQVTKFLCSVGGTPTAAGIPYVSMLPLVFSHSPSFLPNA